MVRLRTSEKPRRVCLMEGGMFSESRRGSVANPERAVFWQFFCPTKGITPGLQGLAAMINIFFAVESASLIDAAGVFIWPLGVCSAVAAFVAIERALALAPGRTVDPGFLSAVREGRIPEGVGPSVQGRLVALWRSGLSGDGLRAHAQAEMVSLQRGLFLLDSAVAIAPLLGLLGTVTGLASLFPSLGQPETARLAGGFGLALSTTALGLAIAIPAQFASQWIARRLEVISARIGLLIEALEARPRP